MVLKDQSSTGKWYLVQCKPRESFRAEAHLTYQSYVCFHPTYPVKRNIAKGVKCINAPLFPHYLFIFLTELDHWSPIRSTRGVSHMVRYDGIPASLDSRITDGLKQHCARLNGAEPEPLYKPGDCVTIIDGCFNALEAIVTAVSGEERVTLLLNLFNRPQYVELPISAVVAV